MGGENKPLIATSPYSTLVLCYKMAHDYKAAMDRVIDELNASINKDWTAAQVVYEGVGRVDTVQAHAQAPRRGRTAAARPRAGKQKLTWEVGDY